MDRRVGTYGVTLALVCALACTPASNPEPGEAAQEAQPKPDDLDDISSGPVVGVSREARTATVLALLSDGETARVQVEVATDPGTYFDKQLADRLADELRPKIAQVEQGDISVDGKLDTDIVRRILRAHFNEVRQCYSSALSSTPSLTGSIRIDFEIAGTGKVEKSAVGESTVDDPKVGKCVAKAAARWRFPKPRGGESVKVESSFVLSPS